MCCKPCEFSRSPVLVYRLVLVYVELSWYQRGARCAETACTKLKLQRSYHRRGDIRGIPCASFIPRMPLSMQRGRTRKRPRWPQESTSTWLILALQCYMHIFVALRTRKTLLTPRRISPPPVDQRLRQRANVWTTGRGRVSSSLRRAGARVEHIACCCTTLLTFSSRGRHYHRGTCRKKARPHYSSCSDYLTCKSMTRVTRALSVPGRASIKS